MSTIIDKLLSDHVIETCFPHSNQILSPIFLVDKSSGGKRFILNLKHLNKFIEAPHFKLEDYRTMRELVVPHCFGATVDLTDAFFNVPVTESSRKYLRFMFQGQLYEFTCLPMGLSTSPFVFHKLQRPIVKFLRAKGIRLVNYLDDYGILGLTESQCRNNVKELISLLRSLGFIINEAKSVTKPSQSFKFLGFLYDSNHMTLSLPLDKRMRILSSLKTFSQQSTCSIRQLAKIIGTLVAACPSTPYGKLYTMHLESVKTGLLHELQYNFDARVVIPDSIRHDLYWWTTNIMSMSSRLHNDDFSVVLTTDASLTGWGSSMGDEKVSGWWSKEESKNHINVLELRAIELALHHFTNSTTNSRILIRADNTTAISCINRQGSLLSPDLFSITRRIWAWCETRKNILFASYIASKKNVVADECSRILPGDTEWSLDENLFQSLTVHFGVPSIDLFASAANSKCSRFLSWHPDPRAEGVDAFTHSWKDLDFYAFPPFVLILKVLRKIVSDEATGILIVPDWPAQPWYPIFFDLLCAEPIYLGPHRRLLFLPFRDRIHPQAEKLRLIAGKLSGKRS